MIKEYDRKESSKWDTCNFMKRKWCWDTLIPDHDLAFKWKLTDRIGLREKKEKEEGKMRDSRL
jgi:hypothetical protein